MAVEADILPPRYDRPRRVGRGGMGDIYRADDTVLGRPVAVKILADRYAQDEAVRDRFKREALAAARLSGDPTTVTIFDVGEWHERPFIVMEYLEGGSLEDVVRERGAQPAGQVLEWLAEAAHALDAAHERGIVHRDVKPANLLLDREGHVHVADFGIASATGMDSLTHTGTILGTAGYLSPEQAKGERATPASDRYALAVVAFELLTGRRPFASDTPTSEAMAHVNADVPSISARQPALPPQIDNCFQRALAKDPADRFSSCTDFVNALRAALHEAAATTQGYAPVAAAPVTARTRVATPAPGAPARRTRGRSPWPLILAGVLAAALAGVALATVLSDDGEEQAAPNRSTVVTRTITTEGAGETEQVTVTATVPATVTAPAPQPTEATQPTATTAAPTTTAAGSVNQGIALTDESTQLIRAGNYAAALPIAQRALQMLQGSGHIYEAYANYNTGKSLLETGRCAEALPYFDRSEAIQGRRSEIDRDRKAAEKCA